MSSTSKVQLANVFTVAVLFLTTFQGMIPTMPLSNPSTVTIVSAVTMFLVTALTAWKQYLSGNISNSAMMPTLIVAIVATVGGLNDVFSVVPIGATTAQWTRFAVTFITMALNILSKVLWPESANEKVQFTARA